MNDDLDDRSGTRLALWFRRFVMRNFPRLVDEYIYQIHLKDIQSGIVHDVQEPSWQAVLATAFRLWLERRGLKGPPSRRESNLARQATGVALFLAGRKRADLRDAWRSDLLTQDGKFIPVRKQLRHVVGYLGAAVRYRLVNDLGGILGRLLDSVLISRGRTRGLAAILYTVPVAMVLARAGIYGLITNAGSLGAIGAGLWAAVRGLRAWRGVQPPSATKSQGPRR